MDSAASLPGFCAKALGRESFSRRTRVSPFEPGMIVFLHIPKTGGTSFRYILEDNLGMRNCATTHAGDHVFRQADFDFARKVFPGMLSMAGHNLAAPARLSIPDPFFVTFLREPVARTISHFQHINRRYTKKIGFEEALKKHDELENLQVKKLAGARSLDKAKFFLEKQCHFVGLTEKFDLSVLVFDKLSPLKLDVRYQTRRVTQNKDAKKSLQNDPRVVELAREINKLDLEMYEFAVNEVFPRLCERAGIRASDAVPPMNTAPDRFQWKAAVGRFYNRVVYRQLCKFRKGYHGHNHARNESCYLVEE